MFRREAVPEQRRVHGAYIGDGRLLVQTKWDTKMLLDAGDLLIAPYLLLDGEWEPRETALFRELLTPGMVFFDIGANVGYYSLIAARMGAQRVFAFEPDPHSFRLLRLNVILNWFRGQVQCEPVALMDAEGARSGAVDLHLRKRFPGNSSIGAVSAAHLSEHDDASETVSVRASTLDTWFAEQGMGRIDLLKVDVEGAEPAVFAGMRETVRKNPKLRILCEWSTEQMATAGQSAGALIALWQEWGFQARWVEGKLQPLALERLAEVGHANLLLERAG